MKRLVGALAVLLAACALVPAASSAAGPVAATGGGRGTVDGVHAFSDFGFSVMRSSEGAVEGHFNCLMAGSSQFPGFTLMAVRGQVTSANISGRAASFDGVGMFQTGNQGKSPATFHVEVTPGGPGVGTLHLTLLTPFLFDLPLEYVLKGQISIE
jgi:opacity protein-like surface antigen